MSWEDVSYVLRSKVRKAVLLRLETPKTPTLLARELHTSTSNISRALRELLSRKLIESLTPQARSGKLLVATKLGREVSSKLKEIEPRV
jgi:DNA-binding MarR family transcriptional regulator